MKKKLILLSVLAAIGCGASPKNDQQVVLENTVSYSLGGIGGAREFELSDGTPCVVVKIGYGVGLSCGWDRPRKGNGNE